MEYTAKVRHLRISPKKIMRYLNIVRGLESDMAMAILEAKRTLTATAIRKLIQSAAAQGEGRLYVRTIFVTPATTLKRMSPRAFGRANVIKKRSSHITVKLGVK